MDLIEQLGGYKEAKDFLEFHSPEYEGIDEENFRAELLQYRRQNNIFEVGDLVVFINQNMSKSVKEIKFLEGLTHVSFNFHPFHINLIRHATPEEVKAGHRL